MLFYCEQAVYRNWLQKHHQILHVGAKYQDLSGNLIKKPPIVGGFYRVWQRC